MTMVTGFHAAYAFTYMLATMARTTRMSGSGLKPIHSTSSVTAPAK